MTACATSTTTRKTERLVPLGGEKGIQADIPLNERSDWEDWMNRDKAEIARLSAEIAANEAKINQLVYELFELTPEEITLLEANI